MRFALDYDGTYTAAPELFDEFIALAKRLGHEVVCVTMRYPHEVAEIPCPVIYTSRRAKHVFMAERPERIDVWIDDKPQWLFQNG